MREDEDVAAGFELGEDCGTDGGLVVGDPEEAVVDVGRGGVAREVDADAGVAGGFELCGEFGEMCWDVLKREQVSNRYGMVRYTKEREVYWWECLPMPLAR